MSAARACQVPLTELLLSVPIDLRAEYVIQRAEDGTPTGHAMVPCGKSMHEAAQMILKDRADAERYRWLRSEEVATEPQYYPFWAEFNVKLCREKHMDALIDAEIAKASITQPPNPKE